MIKNIYKLFFVLLNIALLTNSSFAESKMNPLQQAEADYESGKYKESSEQFQKLYNTLLPQAQTKNQKEALLKIQYNLARALDKAGEFEKARDAYIAVAGDANNKWALQAKFDLGCLYAQMANKAAGQAPAETEEKTRSEIESLLKNALEQWRNILSVEPDYPQAKEKIERVRTVLIQWKKAWKEADLKKEAEEKQPLDYALEIVKEIAQSREKAIALGKKNDSLKIRQEYFELADGPSDTAEKLPILKNKIERLLSNGNPADTNNQALDAINSWINQAGDSLEKSAQCLYQRNPAAAQNEMEKAAGMVDNFYLTTVELVPLVQRAIEQQKAVIERTEKLIQNKKSEQSASDLVWQQQRMQPWTALIAPKAKAQLAQLPPEKPQQKEDGNTLLEKAESLQDAIDALHKPEDKAVPAQGGNPQEEQIQQQRNVCKKAIELGPTIPPIIQSAADNLKENNLEKAVEEQKEALELLEEILKNENQDKQNQDKQNQDKEEQDQQAEQEEQEQGASDKEEKRELQPGELSEAQVRALMRRVQARQEEKKAQDAQLRDILTPPEKVEKDW